MALTLIFRFLESQATPLGFFAVLVQCFQTQGPSKRWTLFLGSNPMIDFSDFAFGALYLCLKDNEVQ